MPPTSASKLRVRPLNPAAADEIERVARRMRATLVEVEGEAVGAALYSMAWLRERVRFHLDPQRAVAQVLLALDGEDDGEVLGHTIVRRELEPEGPAFGLFSTTYVAPPARRRGVADALLLAGEQWMRDRRLPAAATWTSSSNDKLIRLYVRHGYVQTALHRHATTGTPMVKLTRCLPERSDQEPGDDPS